MTSSPRSIAGVPSGRKGLPYYCAPIVFVLNGLGGLAPWWLTKKKQSPLHFLILTFEDFPVNADA